MASALKSALPIVVSALVCTATPLDRVSEVSASMNSNLDEGPTCVCPDGYLPVDGGCCPACYFQTPPCLLPCFICEQTCGLTGDVCDYSQGLTCCAGSQFCCPGGAQSTCSDYACADDSM